MSVTRIQTDSPKNTLKDRGRQGFTLVELSVVLVILGLLVGGVMAGNSLIKAAESRKLLSQLDQYRIAIMTFREQYRAMPGDMANAFEYWGAAAGCTNVDVNTNVNGCNGNGNGQTRWQREGPRAWQFLALAKLVPGNFPGTGATIEPGVNVPRAPMNNAGILFEYETYLGVEPAHLLRIGSLRSGWRNEGPAFTHEEAFNIDRKIDDSHPSRGIFRVGPGFYSGSFDNNCTEGLAAYTPSHPGVICQGMYYLEIE